MYVPPRRPKIYHITHVENLPAIIAAGKLRSDAEIVKRGGPAQMIGMNHIKQRRLTQIKLEECYPEDFVGEYVPFYFCPRSVMLYLIYKRSNQLEYKGGQGPIVHLEADLHSVAEWAEEHDRRWAFSLSTAASYAVEFRNELERLNEINWPAVETHSWSSVRHSKQAEFLVYKSFPWSLVERVGVLTNAIGQQVGQAVAATDHHPLIEIMREWYY